MSSVTYPRNINSHTNPTDAIAGKKAPMPRTYTAANTTYGSTPSDRTRKLYDSLGLKSKGLDYNVFSYTMQGYNKLPDKGNGRLAIIDPKTKKCYVIDVKNSKFIGVTDIKLGHGDMSAVAAANIEGSGATLSGFVKVTSEHSTTKWSGMKKHVMGLERGVNDNADAKCIRVHSTTGKTTKGCYGITPVYKNGQVDNRATNAKIRKLFPQNTIIFTYPTDKKEYERLSRLL